MGLIMQEGKFVSHDEVARIDTPESTADTLKRIGKLVLTVAAGIILSRYGIRVPDNLKS